MTNGILEKQRLETHKSTLEQLKTIPFPPPLKQNQKFSPFLLNFSRIKVTYYEGTVVDDFFKMSHFQFLAER